MKPVIVIVLAACLMAAGGAQAAEMPELAKKNNCVICHAIDKKLIGPAWAEVSKKYKGDPGAAARLNTKIIKGGSGVWGSQPMPGYPQVKDAERKALVSFILGLAK